MKIEQKLVDVAVDQVMEIAFDSDINKDATYRIKFYRKVAWELLKLAAQMEVEYESEF